MKRTVLLLLAILFTSFITNAQIKEVKEPQVIGKVSLLGDLIGELNKDAERDFYFVTYKDTKFTHLTDFKSFSIGNKETVIQFKNIMLDMLQNKTKEKTIELEGQKIYFKKRSNTIEIHILDKSGVNSTMRFINKKQINKLFPADKL